MDADDEQPCRICYGEEYSDASLIEPCRCDGSMAKVHRECLEKWINYSKKKRCPVCKYRIKVKSVPKHKWYTSVCLWLYQEMNWCELFVFILFFIQSVLSAGFVLYMIYYGIFHVEEPTLFTLISTTSNVSAPLIMFSSYVVRNMPQWEAWQRQQKKYYVLPNRGPRSRASNGYWNSFSKKKITKNEHFSWNSSNRLMTTTKRLLKYQFELK